jgi:hypothetical protein
MVFTSDCLTRFSNWKSPALRWSADGALIAKHRPEDACTRQRRRGRCAGPDLGHRLLGGSCRATRPLGQLTAGVDRRHLAPGTEVPISLEHRASSNLHPRAVLCGAMRFDSAPSSPRAGSHVLLGTRRHRAWSTLRRYGEIRSLGLPVPPRRGDARGNRHVCICHMPVVKIESNPCNGGCPAASIWLEDRVDRRSNGGAGVLRWQTSAFT